MRIHPRVAQIPGTVPLRGKDYGYYAYIVEGERRAIIDTGVASTPKDYIEPVLRAMGLSLADIDLILNTHGHRDHAGGNLAIREASGAPIYIHADDAVLLEDPEYYWANLVQPSLEMLQWSKEQIAASKEEFFAGLSPAHHPDHVLTDGEVIDLGEGVELTVIHTPGHSSGNVSFLWEAEGMLFGGDTFAGIWDLEAFPRYFSPSAYRAAMERVLELPFRALCVSHPFGLFHVPVNSVHFGEQAQRFVRDCIELVELTDRAVRRALERKPGASVLEIAHEVLERRPLFPGSVAKVEPLNIVTIDAHIKEARGK